MQINKSTCEDFFHELSSLFERYDIEVSYFYDIDERLIIQTNLKYDQVSDSFSLVEISDEE